MAATIVFYILFGSMALINGQTTTSLLPTSFMGYPIVYQDIDVYSCITATSTVISIDTSTMCLTSKEAVYTTQSKITTVLSTQAPTTAQASLSTQTTTSTSAPEVITSIPLTTMLATNRPLFIHPACANETIGTSCNISADACKMAQPCLNLAKCYPNASIPEGYLCVCTIGFEGIRCEIDKRACRSGSSCLYGGSCNETSNITNCVCPAGKTGGHCEYEIDICANVSCQNNAQCRSAFGNWSCLCTNSELYSGTYCEIKSKSLRVKEFVSRSFAGVAIGCISTVVGFVLVMDILKYCFNVDPIDRDLFSIQERKQMQRRLRRRRWLKKRIQPVHAVRYHYVHA